MSAIAPRLVQLTGIDRPVDRLNWGTVCLRWNGEGGMQRNSTRAGLRYNGRWIGKREIAVEGPVGQKRLSWGPGTTG